MLTCPMCKKSVAVSSRECPTCRADLALLVNYTEGLDDALTRAEDLARADVARMLYLVMERTVGSADFIDAFKTAVAKSYPADKFAAEFAQLTAAVGGQEAEKGDHVSMLYLPGTGLRIVIAGKVDVTIPGAEFARAVWEVYLGPKPIDDGLKRGLVSMLGQ